MSDFLQDRNQQFTSGGAQGTLGTADIKGTAGVVSFSANPTTGAQYVDNIGTTPSLTDKSPYNVQVDDQNTGTVFVGEASVGVAGTAGTWRIKRIVDTGGTATAITWASGNATFDKTWTNRGAYTYS